MLFFRTLQNILDILQQLGARLGAGMVTLSAKTLSLTTSRINSVFACNKVSLLNNQILNLCHVCSNNLAEELSGAHVNVKHQKNKNVNDDLMHTY